MSGLDGPPADLVADGRLTVASLLDTAEMVESLCRRLRTIEDQVESLRPNVDGPADDVIAERWHGEVGTPAMRTILLHIAEYAGEATGCTLGEGQSAVSADLLRLEFGPTADAHPLGGGA